MNFGAPLFFYAFGALAIPVAIHLWSKNTKTKVAFGSLKFLRETETNTTKHLWPSELLLLAVRLLSLTALILALCDPYIFERSGRRTVHLIDPKLNKQEVNIILESLDENQRIYWLTASPTLISDSISEHTMDVFRALEAFSAYDSLIVYSPLFIRNFHSNLISIPAKIRWISLPRQPKEQSVLTTTNGDENQAINLISSEQSMVFRNVSADHKTNSEPIRIYIHSDSQYKPLLRRVQAALSTIQQESMQTFQVLKLDDPQTISDSDWIVWLSEAPVKMRRNLIVLGKNTIDFEQVSNQIFTIPANYSTDKMIADNFPLQLESALIARLNESLDSLDLRTIPEIYLSSGESERKQTKTKKSVTHWALLLFLMLLGLERIMSQSRRNP